MKLLNHNLWMAWICIRFHVYIIWLKQFHSQSHHILKCVTLTITVDQLIIHNGSFFSHIYTEITKKMSNTKLENECGQRFLNHSHNRKPGIHGRSFSSVIGKYLTTTFMKFQ